MSFEHFLLDPRVMAGIRDDRLQDPNSNSGTGHPGRHGPTRRTRRGPDRHRQDSGLHAAHSAATSRRDRATTCAPSFSPRRANWPSRSTRRRVRSARTRPSGAPPSTAASARAPSWLRLRRGVDIVVACPGRLLDHLSERDVDLSHVEILVLDEADRMCDMGFLPDIRRIIRQLPAKRQTLFFSATMPNEIRTLADEHPRQSGDGPGRRDRTREDRLPRPLSRARRTEDATSCWPC